LPDGGPHFLVYSPLSQLPVSFQRSGGRLGGGGGGVVIRLGAAVGATVGAELGAAMGAGGGGAGGGGVSTHARSKCAFTSSKLPSSTVTVKVQVASSVCKRSLGVHCCVSLLHVPDRERATNASPEADVACTSST